MRRLGFVETVILAVVTSQSGHVLAEGANPKPSAFETKVLPLFQAKCLRCHGERGAKAGLNLTSLAGVTKGSENGAVLVPGQPEKSRLFELVRDGKMPPKAKDRFSKNELELLQTWIAADAPREAVAAGFTQHDVIPILLLRCTICHGARVQEGGLDLRTRAGMLRGGKSGPALVPGDPDKSLMLKRIRSGEMPPRQKLVEASIKVIEPAEIDKLTRWIAAGAPETVDLPDVATNEPDPLVTDADRQFWSFQPPRPAKVPVPRQSSKVRNPVDAFLLDKLESHGLSYSSEVSATALLRRATIDLTGLPPEPRDVQTYLADQRPDAYERLIDRLLESPRYGERWGRHWLDVAGYADSDGKREQDLARPFAYRYRDYVIRAFNADKPYDRFLLEQIAGDELADYENAPEITPEIYDNLVATGFLRMAPDPTWASITNFVPDRLDVIADEIDVFGSAVLGLTLKCARCHTHKFDPIPHRDYFRFIALFKGAFDEHDWLRSGWHGQISTGVRRDRELAVVLPAERAAWKATNDKLEAEIRSLTAQMEKNESGLRARVGSEALVKVPVAYRDRLRVALDKSSADQSEVEKVLLKHFGANLPPNRDALKQASADFKKKVEAAEARIKTLNEQKKPEPTIRALWDRGDPSPTYLYRRGDPTLPGALIGPGVPSVLTDGKTPLAIEPPWPGAKKTGRRLALARWLTRPDHPLTARVLVNRVWKHHFGTGLVKTLANFGKAGAPPTHPELLDWLAVEFVRNGWSIKALHRLLMTSSAYRQSSAVTPSLEQNDPDNALISRMPLRRMEAEVLYDSMLATAGRLDESRFGPPDDVQVRPDGLATPVRTERGWRRSIYVRQQRKIVVTYLENFDFPAMNPNCVERRDSTVAPQALHLMNNGMVRELAVSFADRVRREGGEKMERQIVTATLLAYGRPPSAEELASGSAALAELRRVWSANAGAKDEQAAEKNALTTYCHALLNSAEFLYID